jgi:3-phenylpropionate/cinnamic acid dioxygenase small subunit
VSAMPNDLTVPTSSEREIENLLAEYAELVDSGDFEQLGALLGSCVFILHDRPPVRGAAAVVRLAREALVVHDDGTPRTKHVTTNIHLEIDEDAGVASSRSYYTVLQAVAGFPLQPVAAGRYEDRFERGTDRWRFARRRVTIDLVGDVSHHARPAR